MHATTQAIPENGGGGTDHDDIFREVSRGGNLYGKKTIDDDNRFPGFAPPKAPGNFGSGGGGSNTTMMVGENGGGGSTINPPSRPSPTPYSGRGGKWTKHSGLNVDPFYESKAA